MDHFKNALFLAASTRLAPSFRYKNVGKSCIFEFLRNNARHDWIKLKTEDNILEPKMFLFFLLLSLFLQVDASRAAEEVTADIASHL